MYKKKKIMTIHRKQINKKEIIIGWMINFNNHDYII